MLMASISVLSLFYLIYLFKSFKEDRNEPSIIEIPIAVESEKERMDLDTMYYQELERRRREDFQTMMNYDIDQAYKKRSDYE